MRSRFCARVAPGPWLFVLMFMLQGCGTGNGIPVPVKNEPPKASPEPVALRNEIPADQTEAVVRAHLNGLGAMERYEYRRAGESFREVHRLAPGWIPGSINLAIALLNDTGTQAEDARKKWGGDAPTSSFDEALSLLDDVIRRDPENLHARYCRGLILEFLGEGRTSDAHLDFKLVAEKDPADGHAWFKVGATLPSKEDPIQPAGPAQAKELIDIYTRALECNPYLVTALYKLQQAYGWSRNREKQNELLALWKKLNPKDNPAGPGDTAEAFYGESGKYARVINPFATSKPSEAPLKPPRFDPPGEIKVTLPAGDRWASSGDVQGADALYGRVRQQFGITVVTFDANGDGKSDLFLAAAVKGDKGVRDVLLLNKGDGAFEDVSKAWGLSDSPASLGAAAADFDADRHIDLFLCGPGGYRLLRNEGGKQFSDVSEKAGLNAVKELGVTARWLDLDQDGDLDLYVVNLTELATAGQALLPTGAAKVTNRAYRNDGRPAPIEGRPEDNLAPIAVAPDDLPAKAGLSLAFTPWPDAEALVGPPAWYTGLAALDVDDDRDLDLVLTAVGEAPRVVLNDRLGRFHLGALEGVEPAAPMLGLLVADFDKDGRGDLAAVRPAAGQVSSWRNATDVGKLPRKATFEAWPSQPRAWLGATAVDLDLDTWPDVVALAAKPDAPTLEWARNDGKKLVATPLALGPSTLQPTQLRGFAVVDLVGDALPDVLLVPDGAAPHLARNLGNGRHWLALDLGGRWKTSFDHMRTNPHGLGTRITLEGQGLLATHEHTTPTAGLGQSVAPVVLGLDTSPSVDLVRLRWPDGTMQCELNQGADTRLALAEYNRKTGSCPVLFTWNGERFVCLGDFLGGGGLGYLVEPGVYGQPDRDESVAIASEQLRPVRGSFRISVIEPMDEVAYIDQLSLVAVDRPPGVTAMPDERFAPEGPRPTGKVIAWSREITPERATDLNGVDVTKVLAKNDRETIDGFRRLDGWVGYAEEHGIVLDFGSRLSPYGPSDPLVLVLSGWVEYPYSQTNYAAATAGHTLKPPTVERRNPDGTWSVIEPNAGYPAGLPRTTTLDLTGKLSGPSCVIRLRTNLECYWDQAYVALRDPAAESKLRQTRLELRRASLGRKGYLREVSPDGRLPLLYDYNYVDPSPLAMMAGNVTRHGEVTALLRGDDDQLCVIGPGDEAIVEFNAESLPPLPEGWTRGYVLESVGYCKDADPFTAGSDRVEPLPWKRMPAFPFARETYRPNDPAYDSYLRTYQTRPAGAR